MFIKAGRGLITYRKVIAIVLAVIVLLGTSEAMQSVIRYSATPNSTTVDLSGALTGMEQNVETVKELLSQILVKLEAGKDFSSELAGLRASKATLQSFADKVRQGFDDDEKKLRAIGVSEIIMDRQKDMVKSYSQKFEALMQGLVEIEALLNNEGKLKEKVNGLFEYVKTLQTDLGTMQIDTSNLPLRPNYSQAVKASSVSSTPVDLEALTLATQGPNASDLAETPEVQFTPEIRSLAANLSYNPVKIYEYVLNNFDFEVYEGSLKGAQETLWEMAGNDFDLASLLIALYRVSGIPAKYVRGWVEVPIEQIMNWVGVRDPLTAAKYVFATGRVLCSYNVDENGTIVSVDIEHVWVKAYVDYIPSRGAVNVAGDTWVNLDPSFKQYVYADGVNFTKEIPYDFNALADQLVSTATVNQTGSYATGVNASLISSTIDAYGTQVRSYLETNIPNATVGQVLDGRRILKKEYGILPATLPSYDVLYLRGEYSEVPDEYRHKVTFQVYDNLGKAPSLNYSAPTAELAGKRITLSYLGATPADEELIKQYVNETVLPAYLINLKPVLRIDGDIVANGSSVGMGNYQYLDLYITGAFEEVSFEIDPVEKIVFAGAYYAFGFDLQTMPSHSLDKSVLNFENMIAQNLTVMKTDDFIGEILHSMAISYFYMFDSSLKLVEKNSKVIDLRDVAVAIASSDINVTYNLFGSPQLARLAESFSIDMRRMIHSPFAIVAGSDVGGNLTRSFMLTEGYLSSTMENGVLEMLLSAYNVTAVSTVRVLQAANERGIPIFRITWDNKAEILPRLQLDPSVKNDIEEALFSGMVVTVPQTEITIGNWTGSGYVVEDPETGASAFLISGSLNGATGWVLNWLSLVAFEVGLQLRAWFGVPVGAIMVPINVMKALKKIKSKEPDPEMRGLGYVFTVFLGVATVAIAMMLTLTGVGAFLIAAALSVEWYVWLNIILDP